MDTPPTSPAPRTAEIVVSVAPGAAADPGAPVPLPTRGWTPERMARFLDQLAHRGNVRLACARVGLSAEAAYRLRRRDALFARGWDAALVLASETNDQVLTDRAVDGIEEDVWYRGECVGTRRRYDTRLFLAHLARLDQKIELGRGKLDAARFDELLAVLAGEEVPEEFACECDPLPLGREQAGIGAADEAETRLREQAKRDDDGSGVDEHVEEDGSASLVWRADQLDARCRAAGRIAKDRCGMRWDDWRSRAFAAADRAIDWPDRAPAPGLPATPLEPQSAVPASAEAAEPDPRTLSTVSTSALARGLAGPVRQFDPPGTDKTPPKPRRR